jgi:hypothetical protein
MIKDIVFARLAADECIHAGSELAASDHTRTGPITHDVTLNPDGSFQIPTSNPLIASFLCRFAISHGPVRDYSLEFRADATFDELILPPNGTFCGRSHRGIGHGTLPRSKSRRLRLDHSRLPWSTRLSCAAATPAGLSMLKHEVQRLPVL